MPIKDDREYRSMPVLQRAENPAEGEKKAVEGYASTFEEYELFEYDGIHYCERIEPKAFDDTDFSDVLFLYNHTGQVLARTKNGSLTVTVDDHGLKCAADLSGSARAREMYDEITNGLVDQMSFAFTVAADDVVKDKDRRIRVISRIDKVFDVSAVSIPANPTTDISARSWINGAIEQEQAERLAAAEAEEKRKKIKILLEVQ